LALSISDHLAVIVLSVSGNGSRSDRAARDNKARSRDREACPVESPGATGEIEARGGSVCGVGARAATGDGDSLPFRSEAGARRRRRRLTGGTPGQTQTRQRNVHDHDDADDVEGLYSVIGGDALLQSLSLRSKSETTPNLLRRSFTEPWRLQLQQCTVHTKVSLHSLTTSRSDDSEHY